MSETTPSDPPDLSKGDPSAGPSTPPGPPPSAYPPAQGYPPPAGYPAPTQELSPADQRMWAMLAHLGGILFGFLAPLVVYLVQKDRGLYVREQSLEALNFQLTLLIGYVISGVLTFVVIGAFTWILVAIAGLVLAIMAGVAANKGENYRYPVSVRMIS